MCINKRVIATLAVVAIGIYLLAPNLVAAALPLLILAACPLSMLVMMRVMSRSDGESPGTSNGSGPDELSQLRVEVERLRAERQTEAELASRTPEPSG